ncbi:MAG: hypothetical protein EOM61_08105 [Bacteroidia bacterium]|nr:hypothetical protein [Bacteroidia bacterium]
MGLHVIDTRDPSTPVRKFWIEKTIVKGREDRITGDRALGNALWSPQKSKSGGDIYKNMRLVNKGDVILHLIDNSYFAGISIAKNNAIETIGLPGTAWDRPSYLIELEEYISFAQPIERSDILNSKNKEVLTNILDESEVFYNKELNLRQGAYLTPCPKELLCLIENAYHNKAAKHLPLTSHEEIISKMSDNSIAINSSSFSAALHEAGLIYSSTLVTRFVASLLTKPFVILTGLSGSGKTKLAQAFVQWICQDASQYRIVPVGADWTNREPLLGYPNALEQGKYVMPESGVLQLLIRASNNSDKPYFLILDEMNLSHVERYFADFLSVMESGDQISLCSENVKEVPNKISLPSNLFIIGTVNIDETTNMFSPKVLDRANTIEFRVASYEMSGFLNEARELNMKALDGTGAGMAASFLEIAGKKQFVSNNKEVINRALIDFFDELKKVGAEFGYRTAGEILRLIDKLEALDSDLSTDQKIDITIMQKLLPKLHGSRRKLSPVLAKLAGFCIKNEFPDYKSNVEKELLEKENYPTDVPEARYTISLEKIYRMYRGAIDNGFASFAEA